MRVGGVQDDERHARRPADHLRGQRRATHPAEHDPVQALELQLGAQLGQPGDQRPRGRRQVQPTQPDRGLALGLRPPQGGVLGHQPGRDVGAGQLGPHRLGDGEPGTPVQQTYEDAASVLKAVAEAGVDLDDVFRVIEEEGVQKFVDSWDELTESVRSELQDKK